MEPDDDRTGPGTDSEDDRVADGTRRPGRLRVALVTLTLIAVLALIVIGAARLWQV